MRAIIIEEDRFPEVTDAMRLAALDFTRRSIFISSETQKILDAIGPDAAQSLMNQIADAAHRAMHFEFVRWAQSHGASCVKR